jgi:hypothetical protein
VTRPSADGAADSVTTVPTLPRSLPAAFAAGAGVDVLGGLIGLGGAEFRLPLLINGVQHLRRLLGHDRGEETEVPRHCNKVGAGKGCYEAHQSQPSRPAALGHIEARKAEQHQQPSKRVNNMRRNQPWLASNNGRGLRWFPMARSAVLT